MAVIGKIRQRSGLLIFLIGLSIVGFLIMDATNSQFGVLKGGPKDYIGKVNGEKINYVDFEKKYNENLKAQEEQMRGQNMTDEMQGFVRNQTWNDAVNEIIFGKVYEKLGVNVTSKELSDLVTNPEFASPYIKNDPTFKDPNTGQFEPARVQMFLNNLDKDPQGVEPGTVRRQWVRFESSLKKEQFRQKYENLITKALSVPTWLAEATYNDQSRLVDLKYVTLPYTSINDADVKLSDEDLNKYLKENAARFKQDVETRKLQYVTFDIIPSDADTARTVRELEEKRTEFAGGKTTSDDSVFVKLYSETAFDDVYYDKDKLLSSVKDSLFALPVKSVVGPYIEGKTMRLAKIEDRKMISDSVRLREIKISFNGVKTQEEAAAKIKLVDSLFRALDTLKADFGMLAVMNSDDAISKMRGGDAGWVKQGERSQAINNFIFYRAVKGKYYKLPSNEDNAWFILQVVDDKPTKPAVQVAYLTREILPSQETQNAIYSKATAFAADYQTEAKFKEAAKKMNVKTVDVRKDESSIFGLGNARSIIKWAFNAKKGEVSTPLSANNKHVVALVEAISEEGTPSLEAVREQVKTLATRDKKAEMLMKKITDAKAANIDDLAAKLGTQAQQASALTFSTNAALNGSYEPNAVAAALATGAGKVSTPVKGNTGVFVVQTLNVTEPQKQTDYSMFGMQLKSSLGMKARSADQVQKKLADVEDERFEFF